MMKRRDFLKAIPVAISAASCASLPKAIQSKETPVPKKPEEVEEVKQEAWVDLEPERQKYLGQMRATLVERVISPIEQGALNLALKDMPGVREALNELIERNRGKVLDIIDDIVVQIATPSCQKKPEILSKLNNPANELNAYSRLKLVRYIKPAMEGLISLSPAIQKATAQECEDNHAELMEQFKADLTTWANEFAGKLLDLDLDEIQAHVDEYAKENNDMRSDMVITYLPFGSVPEALQALPHKVFDLYLQLAHGNKAEVRLPPQNGKDIKDLFLSPEAKRLAFVGHGSWSQISGGSLNFEPAHIIATIAMDYKKDPDAFMKRMSEATAQAKTPLSVALSIMFELSWEFPRGRKDWFDNPGNLADLKFPDEAVIDKNDPRRQKQIFRYTCGSGRYKITDQPYSGNRLSASGFIIDEKVLAKINHWKAFFSASHNSFVGEYEAEYMQHRISGVRDHEIRHSKYALKYCGQKAQCKTAFNENDIKRQDLVKYIKDLEKAPNSQFAPIIRENPGFGSTFGESRGYEGLAYLPQYLRDPLIENMGGIENFKLKDEGKDKE